MHAPKHVMLVNTFFIISFFLSLSLHVSTACLDAFFRGLFWLHNNNNKKYPQSRPPSQGRHFHGPNEVISISNSTVKKRSNFYFDLLARQWQRCLRFRYTFFTRLSRFKCTFSGCGLFFLKKLHPQKNTSAWFDANWLCSHSLRRAGEIWMPRGRRRPMAKCCQGQRIGHNRMAAAARLDRASSSRWGVSCLMTCVAIIDACIFLGFWRSTWL